MINFNKFIMIFRSNVKDDTKAKIIYRLLSRIENIMGNYLGFPTKILKSKKKSDFKFILYMINKEVNGWKENRG